MDLRTDVGALGTCALRSYATNSNHATCKQPLRRRHFLLRFRPFVVPFCRGVIGAPVETVAKARAPAAAAPLTAIQLAFVKIFLRLEKGEEVEKFLCRPVAPLASPTKLLVPIRVVKGCVRVGHVAPLAPSRGASVLPLITIASAERVSLCIVLVAAARPIARFATGTDAAA